MAEYKKNLVLKDLRIILKFLRLSNENTTKIISNQSFYLIFLLSPNIYFMSLLWYCYDSNFDLNRISSAIFIIVLIVQIQLVYFCMIAKRNVFADIISELQSLFDQSTLISIFIKIPIYLYSSIIIF